MIEQEKAGDGTQHGSAPIRAIHGDIDPTTIFGGNEFVDGRVDRSIFTADPHTCHKTPDIKEPRRPSQTCNSGADQVDEKGNDEEFLSAPSVSQAAKKKARRKPGQSGRRSR